MCWQWSGRIRRTALSWCSLDPTATTVATHSLAPCSSRPDAQRNLNISSTHLTKWSSQTEETEMKFHFSIDKFYHCILFTRSSSANSRHSLFKCRIICVPSGTLSTSSISNEPVPSDTHLKPTELTFADFVSTSTFSATILHRKRIQFQISSTSASDWDMCVKREHLQSRIETNTELTDDIRCILTGIAGLLNLFKEMFGATARNRT